jgi:long-subunit fatty acid transport protein
MRVRPLLVLALFLTPAVGRAQTLDFTIPGNMILPNYSRLTVGQEEGLEGGAFIARTGNSLANWYNPAGLVQVATAQINASATAYEQSSIRLEGLSVGAKGSRFASIGTFFGGVVGRPILASDNVRLGFSYATPIQWRPGTLTGASQFSSGGKANDFGVTTEVELSRSIPGIAAGFRARENLRLGAGLGVAMTSLTQRQSLTLRQVSVDSVLTAVRSSTSSGSSYEALFQAGVQWDVNPRLTVGLHVVSPGLHLLGGAKLSFESGTFRADAYDELVFRDNEADFEYQIPAEAGAGVGYRFERGELEADVTWHGSSSTYTLYESSATGTRTVLVGGVPTVTSPGMAPREDAWASVVNVAVGGNYKLNDMWRLHAGFYTDASPVEDAATSFFRKVDMVGWTGGASIQGQKLSGTLGLGYTSGSSEESRLTDPVTGVSARTKLEVHSFRAAYAISFTF